MILASLLIAAVAHCGTRIRPRWLLLAALAVAAYVTGGWFTLVGYPLVVGVVGLTRRALTRRDALMLITVYAAGGRIGLPLVLVTLVLAGLGAVVVLRHHLCLVAQRVKESAFAVAGSITGTPATWSTATTTKTLPLWPFALAAAAVATFVPLPDLAGTLSDGALRWTTLPLV